MYTVIVTCEHASNQVPEAYRSYFCESADLLKTHQGYDIGAFRIAKKMAAALKCPLVFCLVTRLLVDQNRSFSSSGLFFLPFTESEKNEILMRYYFPYRWKVEEVIERYPKVIHLSIHSFTPVLSGIERNADIGLLYDPQREKEKRLCAKMAASLPHYRVRYNYPYKGVSDGFTTHLRKKYGQERYLGIEIEVNQKTLPRKAGQFAAALVNAYKTSGNG